VAGSIGVREATAVVVAFAAEVVQASGRENKERKGRGMQIDIKGCAVEVCSSY
jgi:hypothetical protein